MILFRVRENLLVFDLCSLCSNYLTANDKYLVNSVVVKSIRFAVQIDCFESALLDESLLNCLKAWPSSECCLSCISHIIFANEVAVNSTN